MWTLKWCYGQGPQTPCRTHMGTDWRGDALTAIHQHYFGKYLVKNPPKAYNIHFTSTGHRMSQLPVYQLHMDAAAGEPFLSRNCLMVSKAVLQKHNVSWLLCELAVMLWDLGDTLGTNIISSLILLIRRL